MVSAVIVAAGILGYYTFRSSREHTQLGEETIAQSLLTVAQQRVERIERYIVIRGRHGISLGQSKRFEHYDSFGFPRLKPRHRLSVPCSCSTPNGEIVEWASRENKTRRAFLRTFRQRLVNTLDLDSAEPRVLQHAHEQTEDRGYLLSYEPTTHSLAS